MHARSDLKVPAEQQWEAESARSRTRWCVPRASDVLEMSERAVSSQHVKSRAAEVEKPQSIEQKSQEREKDVPAVFC